MYVYIHNVINDQCESWIWVKVESLLEECQMTDFFDDFSVRTGVKFLFSKKLTLK